MTRSYFNFFFLVCIGCLSGQSVYAQTPGFTWMGGADIFNQQGVYGIRGVSNAANIPGARENSVTWVDNNNQLWLFGGHGYATTTTQGYLNDLWKYNISTQQWTWVADTNVINQTNHYGTQGVAAPANHPCARQNSHTWADAAGNLWLFGGIGTGSSYYNDLWKFNTTTSQWTWMSGTNLVNNAGTYGAQGTPSTANCPPARFGGAVWFENDHLWLFGGQGFTAAQVRYNDLWKYNIATNEWTWVAGSNATDQNGNYGTLGTANAANTPGARQAAVTWVVNNHFYLFGGDGYPASGSMGYLNDLWTYDLATNQWTWLSGANTTAQPAVYGTLGIPGAANIPGARQMSISFTDPAGYLYLFGGWGYVGPPFGRLTDLWKYNLTTHQWTWVAGPSSTNGIGTYGTMGTSSAANIPGARRMSIGWTDNNTTCWLFGGNGYDHVDSLGLLNDLWQIDIGSTFGVNEVEEETSFNIYPNPATEYVHLHLIGSAQGEWVEIYNTYGQLVKRVRVEIDADIPLLQMPSGMYYVRLANRAGYSKKLMKP